jgi:hypothetical protein
MAARYAEKHVCQAVFTHATLRCLTFPDSDLCATIRAVPHTKTTVYLAPQQIRALKKISERTGIPQSVLIRRAIDAIIKKYKKRRS